MTFARFPICLAGLCLFSLVPAHAQAQETVSIWLSEVQMPSDGVTVSGYEVLGRFQTYSAAAACSLAWSHLHPNSLRLTREREIKVPASKAKELLDNTKQAKDAVDKATKPEERKRGDTIKEYKASLQLAFNRAMNAKAQLTSTTGQLTLKQFNDVNALIRSFNNRYDAASAKGWSFDGTEMSRLEPLSAKSSRAYTVYVFKQSGGQWVRDDTRSFVSNDLDAVQGYVVQVKRIRGWTATTNAPERESKEDYRGLPQYASGNGQGGMSVSGNLYAKYSIWHDRHTSISWIYFAPNGKATMGGFKHENALPEETKKSIWTPDVKQNVKPGGALWEDTKRRSDNRVLMTGSFANDLRITAGDRQLTVDGPAYLTGNKGTYELVE